MKTFALTLAATLVFTSASFASETGLTIDKDRSHIEAMVTAPMESFAAKVTHFDATMTVDLQEKRVGSALIKFRFADLKTGDEKRDETMLAWQQTDQFPECIFLLDALLPAGGGAFKARGKFILHGVTQVLAIPVTITFSTPDTCLIDGDISLDTTAFNLPPIHQYLLLKVNPTLQVKFHLEGRSAAQ